MATWPPVGTSSSAGQPSSTDTCTCRKQGRGKQILNFYLKNETAFVNSNGKMRYAQREIISGKFSPRASIVSKAGVGKTVCVNNK